MAVHWRALWVGEGFNPAIVKEAKSASGAYAIRHKRDHVVRYVGESSRGVLWKTLVRHFQAPDSFAQVRESGIFAGDPRHYEVALLITSRGPRPRAPAEGSKPSKRLQSLRRRGVRHTTAADQRAMRAQAAWIARMKPTKNKDDGLAGVDAAEEYRAHVAKQAAEYDLARQFEFNPGAGERVAGYELAGPRTPVGRGGVFVARGAMRGKPWLRFSPKGGDHPHGPNEYWVTAYKTKSDAIAGDFGAKPRKGPPRSEAELLRLVEAGPAHALPVDASGVRYGANERPVFAALVKRGLLREMPARGRWPARFVVTTAGSHALGSFASADESFSSDAREAGAAARRRAAAEAAAPAGFGKVGKRGQLVMFNPGEPKDGLTLLGLLTGLRLKKRGKAIALRWALRKAPLLAYDGAGRLFIVYRGKVEGTSTAAQQAEYNRTHWGKLSGGKLLGGGVAVGPFLEVGDATEITYTTRKGTAGGGEIVDWVHEFGEGSSKTLVLPRLVAHDCAAGRCGPRCAAAGALGLCGGSYSVTERGIVG